MVRIVDLFFSLQQEINAFPSYQQQPFKLNFKRLGPNFSGTLSPAYTGIHTPT